MKLKEKNKIKKRILQLKEKIDRGLSYVADEYRDREITPEQIARQNRVTIALEKQIELLEREINT